MPPETPKETPAEPQKKEPKKGPPKILLLIAGILAVVFISAAVAFVVGKQVKLPKPIFEEESPQPPPKPPKPYVTHEVGDFVCKLKDPFEDRFAKIEGLRLAFDDVKYRFLAGELDLRKYQIKDIVDTLLKDKTSDIDSKEGKEQLKHEIIEKVNDILLEGKIADVYFKLIVQ